MTADSPGSVCATVLDWVRAALDAEARGVGVAMVAVGGVVLDDCCVGALYVAPERIYQTTDPFPTDAGSRFGGITNPCEEAPIAIEVVVSLFRCIPVLSAQGRPPSAAEDAAAYDAILGDAAIIWNAVNARGLLGDDGYGDTLWLRANVAQQFLPADGGCIGIETRMVLGVGQTGWCLVG